MEVKYRWKNIVCKIAIPKVSYGSAAMSGREQKYDGGEKVATMCRKNNLEENKGDSPFTTSFTQAASANISRLYSGRRLVSILASAREPEPCPERKGPAMRRAESWSSRVAARRLQLQAGHGWFAISFSACICGVSAYGCCCSGGMEWS
jgi:hypothetical protein